MNNRNISILIAVIILSVFNLSFAAENVKNKSDQVQISEDENIKANKATLDKAVGAMNNKDYQSAIVYLTAYINSKPKKYEAYKLRGDSYYALREYDLAQQDYQTAIDLKAADDKLMTGTKYVSAVILGADKQEQLQNPELGNLYGRLMYAQKAQNDYNYEVSYSKAVQYNSHIYLPQPKKEEIARINFPQKYGKVMNPQGIDETIYGAYDDIENEKYTDVIFKSQKIISNYPDYYLGYYLYGIGLNGLEKDEDAIVAFNKAIEKNSYDFESMASLGNIYFDRAQVTFSQDDARKSKEYFNRALKYNKNCYLYHFYIGMNELQLGNNEVAITEFNKAIKIKPNDYNSIYYKSIAQYLKGDYQEVIDSATRLLYKHVSNYNSVLYLRALAQYKLKNYDKSNADLDTILGNFGDIYNADIRVISPKEQTLDNYVYYLKARISQTQGDGAKSDLATAYKNPIIAQLDKARAALEPYEKKLQAKEITLNDYNQYNAFYESSFPKLLQSNVVITETDVDNQYDYIRTTFDDMGLSFVYTNPDYKLSTIKDYPYRKYSNKISKENLAVVDSQASQEVKQDVKEKEKVTPELKTQVAPEELLISDNENSLAKILASNSYGMLGPVLEESSGVSENVAEKITTISEENAQNVQKIVEEEKHSDVIKSASEAVSEKVADKVSEESAPKEAVSEKVADKVSEETAPKETLSEKVADKVLEEPAPKETLSEKVADKVSEETAPKEAVSEKDSVIEKIEKEPTVVKVQHTPENVNEKHANINQEELGLKRSGEPEISEKDEVIVLDKNAISQVVKKESDSQTSDFNLGLDKQYDIAKEVDSKSVMPPVTLPEEKIKNVNIEQKEETPVVNVPQMNEIVSGEKSQQIENDKIQLKDQQVATEVQENKQEDSAQLALRPKAVEESAEKTDEIVDLKAQAKALKQQQKIEKAKIKAEEKLRKQQEKAKIKAEKEKAKAEIKAQKEAAKMEKAAQKAQQALKKEELKVQKAKDEELSKIEKMQNVVEKVLDEKYNIEEPEIPVSKKKTVIKELEK